MPKGDSVLGRNYLPNDLAPLLKRTLVSKTVVVQAQMTMAEADFLFELANNTDFIAGVVAWVDLTDSNVGAALDEMQKNEKFVGVRHQVHDEPDERWLLRKEVVRGLKELERRDLAYDLLLRPPHLKHIPELAEQVPDLRMVVDHIAKPLIAESVMEPWAEDIARVAEIPGMHCKVSGMATEANPATWRKEIEPYVTHVVECFGFDRLMWGSDWPVSLVVDIYDEVKHGANDAVGDIGHAEWSKLMGGNAIEFYKLS
jgi:L-fuconolactonase